MFDCGNGEMRDLLPDLVAGRLTGPAKVQLVAHLARCADCAAEERLIRELRELSHREVRVDVTALAASVAQATSPEALIKQRAALGGRRPSPWLVGIAAAGIAAIALLSTGTDRPSAVDSRGPVVSVPRIQGGSVPEAAVRPGSSPSATVAVVPSREAGVDDPVVDASVSLASDATLEAVLADLEALDAVPAADPDPRLSGGLELGGV